MSIDNAYIDLVSGTAYIGMYGISQRTQLVGNNLLDGSFFFRGLDAGRGIQYALGSFLRIFKEAFQSGYSDRRSPVQIDHVRSQRREDDHFVSGTGDGYVQPSFTSRTVQRTEVHADAPFGIGTIADGEQYHIPFVSLHIFKVLDEQGFFTFQRKGFQFGVEDEEIG